MIHKQWNCPKFYEKRTFTSGASLGDEANIDCGHWRPQFHYHWRYTAWKGIIFIDSVNRWLYSFLWFFFSFISLSFSTPSDSDQRSIKPVLVPQLICINRFDLQVIVTQRRYLELLSRKFKSNMIVFEK